MTCSATRAFGAAPIRRDEPLQHGQSPLKYARRRRSADGALGTGRGGDGRRHGHRARHRARAVAARSRRRSARAARRGTLEAVAGEAKGETCVRPPTCASAPPSTRAFAAIDAPPRAAPRGDRERWRGRADDRRRRRSLGRDRPHEPRRRLLHAARLRAPPRAGRRAAPRARDLVLRGPLRRGRHLGLQRGEGRAARPGALSRRRAGPEAGAA